MARSRGGLLGASLCGLLQLTAVAVAQDAPVIVPPRLVSMPEMNVAPGVEVPDSGSVEAQIIVAADGSASVDVCDASEALCAVVAAAVHDARFEPARRGDEAIAARIRIALRVPPSAAEGPAPPAARTNGDPPPSAANASPSASTPPPPSAAAAALQPSAAAATGEPLAYGAHGKAAAVHPGARRLELAEMRDLPGAFGDPFRAVDALPGVVPIISGLPYFFIRGSPPAGTLYIYDDIPVPALYHLLVGPAAIHPRMVGPITLYSGVAPARYGRLTGGVIAGEGPETPDGRTHLEAELRLLDASAYVQTPALGGTITAAARYGYPALLFSIFSPTVTLAYWDYQLRYAAQLSANDRIELVGLGSYDSFSVTDQPADAVDVTYHRIEARYMHRMARDQFGTAVLFGWEESALSSAFQLKATRVGPRLWYEHPFGERNRLRVSADMQAINGNFSTVNAASDFNRQTSDIGLVGNVHARSLWGVAVELGLRPWKALELQLGVRGDAWLQSGGAEAVIDPRLRLVLHASDELDFHIAGGIVHQPAVFYVPLPGIADLANDQGLQTALQSEAGVGWETPWKLRAELQFFLHRYEDLVFLDTLILRDALDNICSDRNTLQVADCQGASIPRRVNGYAYGSEVFIRRPITERLSGFLSYTLAFSDVNKVAGLPYTPSWDVRHVANLALQWRIVGGLFAGVRWFVRSGKVSGEYVLDDARRLTRHEQRLPGFQRLDAEVAYAWPTFWGRMRVSLEWFNVTMTREPTSLDCSDLPHPCTVEYLPAIFFPNLSVRGEH